MFRPLSWTTIALALVVAFPMVGFAQNTANPFTGSSTGALGTAGNWGLGTVPGVTNDAVFTATTGIRTLTASDLTVGSFNITANTGTFSIQNATATATNSNLTLGGTGNLGNGVSGTSADLLFAAAGSTFNIIGANSGGGTGLLNLVLGQSGNFNIAGTSTISAIISEASAGFGFTKTGLGTLTLSAVNTFTGATAITAGTLALTSTGSIALSSGLTFNGTGAFTYTAAATGSSTSLNALTFSAGEATVTAAGGTSGTTNLTITTLNARTRGATANLVTSGTASTITVGNSPGGFIDQGTFFNGSNYAWVTGAGGTVRSILYGDGIGTGGTDIGAVTTAGGTTLPSATYQQFTAAVTAQDTATFTTLANSGTFNMSLVTNATITTNGILTNGNTTIAGVTSATGFTIAAGASELVIRSQAGNLIIAAPITTGAIGTVSLTKTGNGAAYIQAVSTINGAVSVNQGLFRISDPSTSSSTNDAISFLPNATGITVHSGATLSIFRENYAGGGNTNTWTVPALTMNTGSSLSFGSSLGTIVHVLTTPSITVSGNVSILSNGGGYGGSINTSTVLSNVGASTINYNVTAGGTGSNNQRVLTLNAANSPYTGNWLLTGTVAINPAILTAGAAGALGTGTITVGSTTATSSYAQLTSAVAAGLNSLTGISIIGTNSVFNAPVGMNSTVSTTPIVMSAGITNITSAAAGVGTVTTGSLTMTGGTLNLYPNATAGDHRLILNGAFNYTAGSIVISLPGTVTAANTYNLVSYTTLSSSPEANTTLIYGGNTYTSAQVAAGGIRNTSLAYTGGPSAPGTIALTIAAGGSSAAITWAGNVNNNFDLNTTANFLLAAAPTNFFNQDAVTFNDSASTFAPTIPTGVNLVPGSITFANALNAYTLSGPGSIGNSTGTTTINITGSGAVTVTAPVTGTKIINVTGSGALTVSAPITGTTTFNVTGSGAVSISSTIAGANTLTKTGTGIVTLSGNSTFTGATTISAGIVRLGAAGSGANTPLGTTAAGTSVTSGAALDLNGFTLTTTEALTLNGTGISTGGALTNGSSTSATYGGLITLGSAASIVSNNGNIILSNAGTILGATFGLTLGGTATGSSLASNLGTTSGALTKIGTGTWTLSGASTFTGATTVNAGRLNLTGTLTSAVTVASGATLSGTGSTTGAITFSAGSSIIAGPTGVRGANVTANLTTNIFVNTAPTGSPVTLAVIRYTGTLTGLANFTPAANYRAGSITDSAGTVSLTYTGEAKTWVDADGTWDIGTSDSWTGGSDAKFYWGDSANFGDIAADRIVTLTGTLAPTSIDVGNAANRYTFSGSGSIAGPVTLNKSGLGILVLSTPNTYTGGTNINAGRVVLGNATALSTGLATVASGASLDVAGLAVATPIAISGTGDGFVASLYNGSTTAGGSVASLRLNSDASVGSIIANNASLPFNLSGLNLNGFKLTVATGTIGMGLSNIPNGDIDINSGGRLILLTGGSLTNVTGTITVKTGGILDTRDSNNSTVTSAHTIALSGGTLGNGLSANNNGGGAGATLKNNITVDATNGGIINSNGNGGFNIPVRVAGSLSGSGTLTVSNIGLEFQGDGSGYTGNVIGTGRVTFNTTGNQVFNGVLTAARPVTKTGAGTTTLVGNNSYTGVTTITAGVLQVSVLANGGTSSSIGSATNVAGNLVFGAPTATLRYTGSADVTTNRSFTLSNGVGGGATIESSGTGTLSFDNAIAIAYNTTAQTRFLTLGGTNTGANTFGKVLADNGVSATALTKAGAGTWILTGANTFSGGTTVSGGTLRVMNTAGTSATGTGAVAVNSGTLTGTGTVAGAVTIASGSTFRPGDAGAGTLTTGGLSFAPGSTFAIAVGSTAPTGSTAYAITGAGTLSLDPGTFVTVDYSAVAPGSFDPAQAYSYKVGQSAAVQDLTGITPPTQITTSGYNFAGQFNFSISGDATGGLYLNMTPVPVPEPATILGFAALALGGMRAVRRRSRASR